MDEGPRRRPGHQPLHDSAAVRDTDRRGDHVSLDDHRDKGNAERIKEPHPKATKEQSAANEQTKTAAEERRRWWETRGRYERRVEEMAHQARVREDAEKRRLEVEDHLRKLNNSINRVKQDERSGKEQQSAGSTPGK